MKRKKGLSLLVLTITILVMIVLASVVIFISANTTNNSKKAAFASDLEQLEDLVREYYLANNTLPVVADATIYSKSTFTALITDGKDTLTSEIAENGDDDAVFYKLDLSKLDVKSSKRGLEEDGDITDAYYVASNTFNVYYLQGEEIAGEYYFSISERLNGKVKVANSQTLDTSNITISSVTGAITLTKNTAEYTNALTVGVKVTLEAGETMKYTIAGQEITVAEGTTTIDVANIVSSNSTLQTAFYQSENNKYILAQKYSSGNVVAEAKMNIANLDILSGSVSSASIEYTKYDKFTLGKISGYTDLGGSGVKETRVLYLTKKSGDAYYTNLPDTITKEYVKQTGKTFSATSLKLPEDVKTFALVFIDNAGNVSEVGNFTVVCLTKNAEAALAAGIQIGDIVTGYTLDASKTSYTTSGNENTGPDFLEEGPTAQTVTRIEYTTWRYVGIGENGELLIAPDMVSINSITNLQKIELSGKGGYLNGPKELNNACAAMYSTNKGTARSINVQDVCRILDYSGLKYYYNDFVNNEMIYFETPKRISEVESLMEKLENMDTPDGRNIGEYFIDNFYLFQENPDILKSITDETRKSTLLNFIFTSDYWLADSCCDIYLSSDSRRKPKFLYVSLYW